MSEWYDITKEDIAISDDGKTLEVHIGHNYDGNIYVEIPIDCIKEVLAAQTEDMI